LQARLLPKKRKPERRESTAIQLLTGLRGQAIVGEDSLEENTNHFCKPRKTAKRGRNEHDKEERRVASKKLKKRPRRVARLPRPRVRGGEKGKEVLGHQRKKTQRKAGSVRNAADRMKGAREAGKSKHRGKKEKPIF